VRLLAERAVHVQLEAAERVVREGGPGDALYIVLRGTLLVHRAREGGGDDEAIARLEPGQFFGEIALLTGEPRNADVSTISEAMLLRVPALALYEAVARIEGFTELLVKTARERSAGAEVPEPDVLRRTAATALSRAEAGREASLAASLKRIALFAELSAADRDELADASFIARYGAASTLVRQGRQGPGLCTLLSGTARVIRDGREIASLVEGDFFGEINLLTGSDATATVRSSKPVVLAVLRWRDLESVLARNPAVGVRLLGAFASRLARAETAVEIPEALLDEIARNPEVLRSLAQKIAEG
jgi:CRP-like cAMP-binding protein